MSSPIDWRASRSIELLEQLRKTLAEYAKKEEQLSRLLNTRRFATTRKHREVNEEAEQKSSKEIADAQAFFGEEKQRLQGIQEKRRGWIQRAHAAGLRELATQARAAKERWLGDLQMKHFRAERALPGDLKAADAAHAAFSAKLDEQQETLTTLERRTRSAFGGYWMLQHLLRRAETEPDAGAAEADRDELFARLSGALQSTEEQLRTFRGMLLPKLFKFLPLLVLIPLILLAGLVFALQAGSARDAWTAVGIALGGVVVLCILFVVGLKRAAPTARAIADGLTEAARLHAACTVAAAAKHQRDRQHLNDEFARTCAEIRVHWDRADEVESEVAHKSRTKLAKQMPRALTRNRALLEPRLEQLAAAESARLQELRSNAESRQRELAEVQAAELERMVTSEKALWDELAADWQEEITPITEAIDSLNAASSERFPAWNYELGEKWEPPQVFSPAAKFAQLQLDISRNFEAPKDRRLAFPGPRQFSIPLALSFPSEGSLLFETHESGGEVEIGALNNIIFRLLATTPPGKLSFTIIDPVGLGQNFAGLMHLSDYEESLINRRIWTQRDQIEERLAELSEHIEKVIQMYLRNEYATITEYNAQAGSVAEKYHFLVIADFPANFSDVAAKRLQSIATSGPRCGVYTLIHWDQRHPMPDGLVPDELRKNSVCVKRDRHEFILTGPAPAPGAQLLFDPPPDQFLAVLLVQKIGKSSIDSNRVEVPFAQIAPSSEELWRNDTTTELKVAIGRTGATKQQYLAIGKGTRQHALFAGKTGSGKSTLFHVIITNLALACSPEQVEFYLIDFKKGVEFKCYASKRLPHARVVAIESDREFALSVLQRVDEELKRRGDMFRKLGVQDIAGYKRTGGTEAVPRTLLIIDEFQEFFVDDDAVAQTASLLFDRIVRQGRAFGIHVLLGSQTLGGAYSLARATLGQMAIRVALQCNEADAYLIMDENNAAPRLLSRPGEGIYNDASGAMEGNSPFQVVWLADEERDRWLDKVNELAEQRGVRPAVPIVFEGNAPADVRENQLLETVLTSEPRQPPVSARCWLGAPNSIKGPTQATFHRQSGNHLLIVGQREEAALSILGLSMLALAAQFPVGTAKFILFHAANPGSADDQFIERILAPVRHEVTISRGPEIAEIMSELSADLKARTADSKAASAAPTVFLFVHGLHKFKKLRQEDDFSFSMSDADAGANTGAQFTEMITEGSSVGMHLLVTVDTFNNVNRSMSRKALSEFEMRVVFQMSANDSASLIDSPKASNLGLHRALFYNEHDGTMETFRPYATPDANWIAATGARLNTQEAVDPAS